MAANFSGGDHVGWDSEAGEISGTALHRIDKK